MFVSKTLQIADELEKMIDEQYAPGDSFFTAYQLAAEKKISGTTANNVLKILEHRRVITRAQRKGAFVADRTELETTQERIVIVRYQDATKVSNADLYLEDFVISIQKVFPEASIQVSVLDNTINDETIMAVLGSGKNRHTRTSYVLWSVPLSIQRFFANTKFPCVLYGTRYPSIPESIPSVDRNIPEAVQLVRNHLLGKGRGRFACLFHSQMVAGDIVDLDEFQSAFQDDVVYYKLLPYDEQVYEYEIFRLLDRFHPDALICQTDQMAEVAARCCRNRGIEPGTMADIIIFMDSGNGNKSPFPHIVEDRNTCSKGQRAANLLKSLHEGKKTKDILIPVQLVIPGRSGMSF